MAQEFWWVAGHGEQPQVGDPPPYVGRGPAAHETYEEQRAQWRAREAAMPRPTEADLAPLGVWSRDGEVAVMWRPHPQWAAALLADPAWSGVSVRAGVLPWREIRPWQSEPTDPRPVMAGSWPEAVALALRLWDEARGVSC